MKKTLDLCGICFAQMQADYNFQRTSRPVNYKITCAICGRRRYGATYEAEPKEAGKHGNP